MVRCAPPRSRAREGVCRPGAGHGIPSNGQRQRESSLSIDRSRCSNACTLALRDWLFRSSRGGATHHTAPAAQGDGVELVRCVRHAGATAASNSSPRRRPSTPQEGRTSLERAGALMVMTGRMLMMVMIMAMGMKMRISTGFLFDFCRSSMGCLWDSHCIPIGSL